MDLSAVELHLFCHHQPAQLDYLLDDRESQRYQSGGYGAACIAATIGNDSLRVAIAEAGSSPRDTVRFTPVIYGRPEARELELVVNDHTEKRPLRAGQREWLCRELAVRV